MFPRSPDNQPLEDDAAMQVDLDESVVPHRSYPSTPMLHTLPSSQSTVSIPDDAFQVACSVLEVLINPSHSDASIEIAMATVRLIVYDVLGKDPALSPRRANEKEFLQNVERIGKQQVINAFKDAAEKEAWGDLMSNGTFPFPSTSIVLITFCCQRYFSCLKLYGHRRTSLR